jgi:putative SOS response-associated peptidase YedK
MINARAETVAEKPAFRAGFAEHRCLVIADGFFEWRHEGAKKTPFYVHQRSGEPFAFAGLYSDWTAPEGGTVRTSAIVTTCAYALLAPIHDRMPVILRPEDYDLWLDPAVRDRDRIQRLLAPSDRDDLELYEVTTKVNSPKNDLPENIVRTGAGGR